MIEHAFKYVKMSERVRDELHRQSDAARDLALAEDALAAAETALVQAYRNFRAGLLAAVAEGSDRARAYYDATTWDLT
jgi:hypothetical protein